MGRNSNNNNNKLCVLCRGYSSSFAQNKWTICTARMSASCGEYYVFLLLSSPVFFLPRCQSIVVSYFDSNITTIVFDVFNFSVNAIEMIEEREKKNETKLYEVNCRQQTEVPEKPGNATAQHSPNLSLNNRDLV